MATDPVCNMTVDETTAKAKTRYEGRAYYFCSTRCRTKFELNPEQYVRQLARPQSRAHAKH